MLKKYNNFKVNESSIDYDMQHSIEQSEAYKTLCEDFSNAIEKFEISLEEIADKIGYDNDDSDHDMARGAAIQDAINNCAY